MATRSGTEHIDRWPDVASAADLYNVAASPNSSAFVQAGDREYVAGEGVYECVDPTVGAAIWRLSAAPVSGVGTATIDFGSAPGASTAEVSIAGQVGFTAASHAEAWLQGDATATHNAYEHLVVPMVLRIGNQAAGSFTIYASTDWRLDGTFTVHWAWSN